jgi:hypothetical protein
MMKRKIIPIADVYVPIKRRATLEQKRVDEIAASTTLARSLVVDYEPTFTWWRMLEAGAHQE